MKISKKIILLGLTLSVLFAFSCKTNEKKSSPAQTNEDFSKYDVIADAATKQCPMDMGNGIQMDKVSYIKNSHTLEYTYRFTEMSKSDNTAATWNLMEAVVKESLIAEFKSQTSIEVFRKDKLNLSFVCNDKNNVHLFTILLKNGDY